MRITADDLYNLLPAVHRIRDVEQGGPLRAMIEVIATQGQALEDDIADLYRNWFIETCDEWVTPYIGDLLGVRSAHGVSRQTLSSRAFVANTIAYRRRKGTASVIEALARDVTGWPARAVEFFKLLSTTQHLNHTRPENVRTPDLRDSARLALTGGPFDTVPRTVDVRRITDLRGRYNLSNVGIFLWRLGSYPIERGTPRAVADPPDGRYRFNPLGIDAPLFNRPRTETEIEHIAEERDVPAPLRRRALFDDLERYRQSLVDGERREPEYFGATPVIRVFLNEGTEVSPDEIPEIPPARIAICDLSDWGSPASSKSYTPSDGGAAQSLPIAVAVDPELGRIAFPAGITPTQTAVSYSYGFGADLGGGPYDRDESIEASTPSGTTWRFEIGEGTASTAESGTTLTEAVQAWNALPAGTAGTIVINDSRTYAESLTAGARILVPAGSRLAIVADDGERPHVQGAIHIEGTAEAESESAGVVTLDGLLIEQGVTVGAGHLGALRLTHCSIPAAVGALTVESSGAAGEENDDLSVELERCVCGAVTLAASVPSLAITDSIISGDADGGTGATAIDAEGADARIEASTIFGLATVRSLQAGNSIFTGIVTALRRQSGCVRFCALPYRSQTPRRHRCQPELALSDRATAIGLDTPTKLPAAEQALIVAALQPVFVSRRFGNPGYARLDASCADGIRAGGDDGAEMGAFHLLKEAQRESNLRGALGEYLRFGFEAGIFYVT